MIPELQSPDHFDCISLWDAARVFPIFFIDRFEQPRDDGAVSVAAARREQAQSTLFWAEQLMQVGGKEKISGHPYIEGFTYTSYFSGARGGSDWCVRPFEMAQCLMRAPPKESDFDYSSVEFLSRCLARALPDRSRKLRPIYDPTCLDEEREPFLAQLQQK